MFSRWSQENFFNTMRHEFILDAIAVHDLTALDETLEVVNPNWREFNKQVKNINAKYNP